MHGQLFQPALSAQSYQSKPVNFYQGLLFFQFATAQFKIAFCTCSRFSACVEILPSVLQFVKPL